MSAHANQPKSKHRLNPRKLLLSKWTAAQPQNREKHFLVTELYCAEDGSVLQIELQPILSKHSQCLDWRVLEDVQRWHMGWK